MTLVRTGFDESFRTQFTWVRNGCNWVQNGQKSVRNYQGGTKRPGYEMTCVQINRLI